MTNAIETRSLTKLYDGRPAIADLDWSVPTGTAWALLGHNGAGKSTTLRMLMGFTPATRGDATVLGDDSCDMRPATRTRLAYVAENPALPPWLRVDDLTKFHASFYPRWDVERERRLFGEFDLPRKAVISTLSKGQNRRLMLLLALCQGADLMILDEPASGLDVAARRRLLSLLGEFLAEDGNTLVISSHIVTDVERIVSHVAVMRHAELAEATELDELQDNVKRVRMPRDLWDRTADAWRAADLLGAENSSTTAVVTVRRFTAVDPAATRAAGVEVIDLGLEDIFLAISEAQPSGAAS